MSKIYLIGLPGSGKSTLGKRLSMLLNFDYHDLDDYIEKNEGKSIKEIFELFGEERFRELERHYLIDISKKQQDLIVSTGGGTPCFFDNLSIIKLTGVSIYLNARPEFLALRLRNTNNLKRPMFKNLNHLECIQKLENLLHQRNKYYEEADIVISAENPELRELMEKLMQYGINEKNHF